ncbi:hypothetical protein C7446_2319 [Kushneria sinocarnis]|uniref:Uncharacterized protein n=1 Tax=Kushneria sinocarnis TaxID=595502 RepID=A0A420WVJ5_9GAMM|nr:hypothetical protein [Kushneria sinocarnis]RKR02601.1 hypothetical protein C7446_2319 [Kushneria sinocarnis]
MIQKLENIYLGILRIFVVIVSGILLVSSLFFAVSSLQGFSGPPDAKDFTPEIDKEELKKEIIQKNSNSPRQSSVNSKKQENNPSSDPNQNYYEETADNITSFINSTSTPNSVSRQNVIRVTKQRAESFNSRLTTAYAKGLSNYSGSILSDDKIIEKAKKGDSIKVLNEALGAYHEEFKNQLNEEDDRLAQERLEHRQAQANAATNLYIASGSFAGFLLIVFLSIFIKIERNLRNISIK